MPVDGVGAGHLAHALTALLVEHGQPTRDLLMGAHAGAAGHAAAQLHCLVGLECRSAWRAVEKEASHVRHAGMDQCQDFTGPGVELAQSMEAVRRGGARVLRERSVEECRGPVREARVEARVGVLVLQAVVDPVLHGDQMGLVEAVQR
jgi:hypothetical protein